MGDEHNLRLPACIRGVVLRDFVREGGHKRQSVIVEPVKQRSHDAKGIPLLAKRKDGLALRRICAESAWRACR